MMNKCTALPLLGELMPLAQRVALLKRILSPEPKTRRTHLNASPAPSSAAAKRVKKRETFRGRLVQSGVVRAS
jgi:hypothetical protein